MDAVTLLKELNQQRRRKVPEEVNLDFAPPKWLPHLVDSEGRIDRHSFELCVLYQLRGALRSGDAWLEGSRRSASPCGPIAPASWTPRDCGTGFLSPVIG